MHGRPRKKTETHRILLTEDIRVILDTEPDAPPGGWRRVQILIPASPDIFVTVDQKPEDVGLNRNYKLPLFTPGAQIPLSLLSDQWLIGCAGINFGLVTLIVEYFGGE